MKRKAIAAVSAALLSLSLAAGTPAVAQAQLDDAVQAQLVALGFLPADWMLTQEQVLELQNVLGSTENDGEKQAQVRQIVGDAADPEPVPPQPQLDDAVNAQLVGLGFMPSEWTLTEEQQIELQNLLSSNESDDTKKAQVRQIVGID